jgi:sentrin-specific protease 1
MVDSFVQQNNHLIDISDDVVLQHSTSSDLFASRQALLTISDNHKINEILSGPDNDQIVIDKFDIQMTRHKLLCLTDGIWLNDEVINFYMKLLQERDAALCASNTRRLTSNFFNSFFLAKIMENNYTYNNVLRWTTRFNVFNMDKLYFPVNIANAHWAMAVIFMRYKTIIYYDSLRGSGETFVDTLLHWLQDEAHRKNVNFDPTDWILLPTPNYGPRQGNGYDCGVFSIMCADYTSDNLPLDYNQSGMIFYRRHILASILRGSLNYPFY